MLRLEGIVPPVVTPLTDGERVDEEGLRRQLRRLLDAGVRGIFFLGTTGEQPALLEAERGRAIEVARDEVGDRVPLVVGAMAPGTGRAVENIAQAQRLGADAVAVTPPYYYPTQGAAEQVAHYRACAASAAVPVVIYNIPQTTKVMLQPETIAELAAIPNIAGLKDSSQDFIHFLKILEILGERQDFSCLIGSPPLIGAAVLFGAAGGVPGIANLDPALLVALYEAARRRAVVEVTAIQQRVLRLMRVLAFGAPVACLKTALEVMGVCGARTCAPTQPISEDGRRRIAAILREQELV
jgi:4-hydroxy-tetrahydrodipicolinate synthase